MASPYEILGVDPDADEGEIVDAYRQRVKETHPDTGGSVREFRAVQRAYEQIRSGAGAGDGHADGQAETVQEPPERRVRYLNYEVLDDYGWTLEDETLFEKAADAGLDTEDYGQVVVESGESLLEAAERHGLVWPYACRGGACSNCAVAVIDGTIPPPTSHVLTPALLDRGIRLSCITAPITAETDVVYNVKHLPDVQELLLPASRFENETSTD